MNQTSHSIKNHEENMTIYYRKQNGEIKMISDGIHDMSIFGNEQCDYEMIWDFIVIPLTTVVKENSSLFFVNIQSQEVQFKSDYLNPYIAR